MGEELAGHWAQLSPLAHTLLQTNGRGLRLFAAWVRFGCCVRLGSRLMARRAYLGGEQAGKLAPVSTPSCTVRELPLSS